MLQSGFGQTQTFALKLRKKAFLFKATKKAQTFKAPHLLNACLSVQMQV